MQLINIWWSAFLPCDAGARGIEKLLQDSDVAAKCM